MMDVDDEIANAKGSDPLQRDLEEGAAANLNQRFGTIVSEGPQPGSAPGRQDHRLHRAAFCACVDSAAILSNSRCVTTTSIPGRPRSLFATCSARYTERCCPPVHPNDNIRFLKPRC